jgi:hypothetical protein
MSELDRLQSLPGGSHVLNAELGRSRAKRLVRWVSAAG